MRRLLVITLTFVATCAVSLAQEKQPEPPNPLLAALETQILYHPRKYTPETIAKFLMAGSRLDYPTSQGAQTAWLIPPSEGDSPEKVWLVCGGNGTLALELAPLCRSLPFKRDAWLLVDYPGYGECAGSPSPQTIRENIKSSVLAAAPALKLDTTKLPDRLCAFGHSLGCAAALMGVTEFHLRSAVLCAPFTSSTEMAREKFRLPDGVQLLHRFDNRAGLADLQKIGGRAWIFHGEVDEVIPVAMSKTLASEFKDVVVLSAVAGASHNNVIARASRELAAAMAEARKHAKR